MPTTTTIISTPNTSIGAVSTTSASLNAKNDEDASVSSTENITPNNTNLLSTSENGACLNEDNSKSSNSNNTNNGSLNNANLISEQRSDIHLASPITINSLATEINVDLNIKTNDLSCLNIVTSSPSSSSNNSNVLLAQCGSNVMGFGPSTNSPEISPWSTGDENPNNNINNISGFGNFPSNHNFNGHLAQQRRPITSAGMSHQGHGLSPNSVGRLTPQHQHQQQFNQYKNNYSAWSNPGPTSPWQQQQMQNQPQQSSISPWNRGRSAPNLNPMVGMQQRKPPINNSHQYPNNQTSGINNAGMNQLSPSKYRRSTSYPDKNMMNMQGYNMMNQGMDMNMDSYMPYQVN
jgi:hypothetical protein